MSVEEVTCAEVVTTVPALRMRLSIEDWAPWPMATMTMTAATPMIIPSAVSAVRIALRRRAVTAIDNVVIGDMGSTSPLFVVLGAWSVS